MVFISVTRLRLRAFRFFFPLAWHTGKVNRQIAGADGCLSSKVRGGPSGGFWTVSVWRDEAAMRAFMTSGAHLAAMPKLKHWCDEASAVHWTQESAEMNWADAEGRLAQHGWTSKILHPSLAHAAGSPLGSPRPSNRQ